MTNYELLFKNLSDSGLSIESDTLLKNVCAKAILLHHFNLSENLDTLNDSEKIEYDILQRLLEIADIEYFLDSDDEPHITINKD